MNALPYDAETALRESEQHYRQLLAAVTSYTYTVHIENSQAVLTEHGWGCVPVTGCTPDEFAADPYLWLRMIHPTDREAMQQHVDAVLADQIVPPIEHRILHRDGSIRWVRDTIVLHHDAEGRFDRYDGLVEDITERKRAEELFRRLLEAAPDAMVIVDPQGKIVLVNQQTEQLFGYTREELLGQAVEILIPQRYRGGHSKMRDIYMADPRPRPIRPGVELCGLRKDGREFPAEISLSPLETDEGLLVSSAIRDITDRKQTERELRENRAKMLAAQKIQERLLPDQAPLLPGFDIAGGSYPAEFTAGDYYDYLPMQDDSIGIVIGDVSGHGFGPALVMASTYAHLRSLAQAHNELGEIPTRANRSLIDESDHFVTLLLARLDPHNRSLVYISAGHATSYALDPGGSVKSQLESNAMPLAVLAETEYWAQPPIDLEEDDLVLLLTDGVQEAQSAEGEFFGIQRALTLVHAHRHLSASQIIDALYAEVCKFCGNQQPHDDVTAVLIKVVR